MNDIRIGIGVTSYVNTAFRAKISRESIAWLTSKAPKDAIIVIIDDGSPIKTDYTPFNYWGNLYVHRQQNKGVAKSKNKCIEMLLDKGCTDIFLFDDDCWIQDAKYYYEYAYQEFPFMNLYPVEHIDNPRKIYSHFKYENRIYVEAFPYGSCLYFKREIFDIVGGYNILTGPFGEEHRMIGEAIYKQEYVPKVSFDFYRPNKDYPIIIHPDTYNSLASSLSPQVKKRNIQNAQTLCKRYEGIKCPYRESEYPEFLKNVQLGKFERNYSL